MLQYTTQTRGMPSFIYFICPCRRKLKEQNVQVRVQESSRRHHTTSIYQTMQVCAQLDNACSDYCT